MAYEKVARLNKGAYGVIYSAKKHDNENEVVIKRILFKKKETEIVKGILGVREIDFAKSLDHPYILKGIEFLEEKPFTKLSPRRGMRDDRIYLVFPKARYTLTELIYECVTPISHIKRAMYQTLVALDYLHSRGICHRDIKPDNILCFYDNGILTTKICDFGMSKPLLACEKNSTHAVTSVYRPPELLLGNRHYDMSIDIWALGISFYEMVMKEDLFFEQPSISHLTQMFRIFGTPKSLLAQYKDIPKFKYFEPKGIASRMTKIPKDFEEPEVDGLVNTGTWEQFIDLLEHMLKLDPKRRYTAYECLKHPFFSGFYQSDAENYGLLVRNEPYPIQQWNPIPVADKDLILNTFKPYFDDYKVDNHRILFLAMDLYMRLLNKKIKMEEMDKYCIYLAFKYFCDIQSPFWNELFPTEPKRNLSKIEIQILKELDYIIFRPLLWDMVIVKNSQPNAIQMMEFILNGKNETQIEELI